MVYLANLDEAVPVFFIRRVFGFGWNPLTVAKYRRSRSSTSTNQWKKDWIRRGTTWEASTDFLVTGWWFQTWLDYFPLHIWDVILPIDELHHFSRWAHCTSNQVRIHFGMGQNLLNTRIWQGWTSIYPYLPVSSVSFLCQPWYLNGLGSVWEAHENGCPINCRSLQMRVTRKDYVYYMESSLMIFLPCPAVRNASQKVVFQRFNPCIVPLTNMTDWWYNNDRRLCKGTLW